MFIKQDWVLSPMFYLAVSPSSLLHVCMARVSFFCILFKYVFQVNLWSRWRPRYLTSFFNLTILPFRIGAFKFFNLLIKETMTVLSGLMLNPFLWYHSVIRLRGFYIFEDTASSYLSLTVNISSSVYLCIWKPASVTFHSRSLTTIDQSKGDNTTLRTSLSSSDRRFRCFQHSRYSSAL